MYLEFSVLSINYFCGVCSHYKEIFKMLQPDVRGGLSMSTKKPLTKAAKNFFGIGDFGFNMKVEAA